MIYIKEIVAILENNEELIEYDYKGNENQISITKKLRDRIYDLLATMGIKGIQAKDAIKASVREAFELEDSDIIVVREQQIFIKLLDNIKINNVDEEEKNTIANRYNGIDDKELIEFYNQYFTPDESKSFFQDIAQQYVQIYFLDKKIDNESYEKSVFSSIQEIILKELQDSFDDKEQFFIGFSGYVFRKHFKEVFGYISDLILIEVARSNVYIINFLKYYSLNIIAIDGMKYQVPALIAENGNRWNAISITAIARVYVKLKSSIKELKLDIEEIENDIDEVYIGELSPVEYKNKLMKKQMLITDKLNKIEDKIDACKDALELIKDDKQYAQIHQQMKKLKIEYAKQRDEKATIMSKIPTADVIKRYNYLENEITYKMRQLNSDEIVLEKNEKSYSSLKQALSKVLTSKKYQL